MTSAWSITESANPPRAAFLDYPLGHTTGRPDEPELQRSILRDALAGFDSITEPGTIIRLDHRWPDDDWKLDPMGARRSKGAERGDGAGDGSDAINDTRTARNPEPQYQTVEDFEAAKARHGQAACEACVGFDR